MKMRYYVNLPAVVGVLCALAGTAALAFTLAQNASFGESLGSSWRGIMISAGGSVVMDSFAAILAVAIGLFLSCRHYGRASLLAVPLLFYLAYSMLSSFGFGMNERMAKAERIRDAASEARLAVQAENALAIQERAATRAMLASAYAEADRKAGDRKLSRIARTEAVAEKKRITESLRILDQNPPPQKQLPSSSETVLADPQAEIIARYTGFGVDTVSIVQIGMLAVGLPLAKILGYLLASVFFHLAGVRARARQAEVAGATLTMAEARGTLMTLPRGDEAPVEKDIEAELRASISQAVEDAANDQAPLLGKTDPVEDDFVVRQHAQVNDVVAYITHATEPAPNFPVAAREFLRHYKAWSRKMGRTPTVSNTIELGHLLRGYGLGRVEDGNGSGYKVYYVGRKLRPLQETTTAGEVGLKIAA